MRAALERASNAAPQTSDKDSQNSSAVFSRVFAGAAAARSGNLPAARAELAAAKPSFNEDKPRDILYYHYLEGEVTLAGGDLKAAEAAFAAGEPESGPAP